jgi:hypothetical protein
MIVTHYRVKRQNCGPEERLPFTEYQCESVQGAGWTGEGYSLLDALRIVNVWNRQATLFKNFSVYWLDSA